METGSKLTFDDSFNLDFYSDIESATDGAGDIYKLSTGIVNMHGRYDEYKGKVHIEDGDFNFVGGSNFGGTISAKVEEGESATINNLSQEKDMSVGSIEKTGTGTLTITNNAAEDSKLTFEDVVTIGENNVSGNLTSGGVVEVNSIHSRETQFLKASKPIKLTVLPIIILLRFLDCENADCSILPYIVISSIFVLRIK